MVAVLHGAVLSLAVASVGHLYSLVYGLQRLLICMLDMVSYRTAGVLCWC
jgi:hypothetical protein